MWETLNEPVALYLWRYSCDSMDFLKDQPPGQMLWSCRKEHRGYPCDTMKILDGVNNYLQSLHGQAEDMPRNMAELRKEDIFLNITKSNQGAKQSRTRSTQPSMSMASSW